MAQPSSLEQTFDHWLTLLAPELPAPVCEYVFAPPRKFRADRAWPERKLLIELDGGIWSGGRHVRPSGYEADLEKSNLATAHGYRVLKFSTKMLTDDPQAAIDSVRAAYSTAYGNESFVRAPQTISIVTTGGDGRLASYEAIIEDGIEKFWKVGMALAAIRSEKLYLRDYPTFDAYCIARWGFSASRARQLILGTSTNEYIESVTGVTLGGEREARALRKYRDDMQPLIVETVINRYGGVTESRIKRVGDNLTQMVSTGHVDVNGIATPMDAALNLEDEEASKRADEYAKRKERDYVAYAVEVQIVQRGLNSLTIVVKVECGVHWRGCR